MTEIAYTLIEAGDTDQIEARYRLRAEIMALDFPYDPPPSRHDHLLAFDVPWAGQRTERWLARIDGLVVGEVELDLPELDNLENASGSVLVHPASRRLGVGARLAEFALDRARAFGRKRVMTEVCEDGPPTRTDRAGAAFLTSLGGTRALVDERRRLHIDQVDRDALQRLMIEAESASRDYELVRWRAAVPDDLVQGIAILEGRMVLDAPMGDLAWEQENYDAARIRDVERVLDGRQRRRYGTAAVHLASGAVAGYTLCVIDADVPQHAWQWATIVLPEHRGNRLGLRLKSAQLTWMLEDAADLETIDTWNAAENTHMIKVNEQLGFRLLDTWAEWQLELT